MDKRRDRQLELDLSASNTARSDERVPLDQESRAIIRGELGTNLMVLAGAGAGKTYELVERMVALLAEDRGADSIDIRNIAAITFTRKAAGELRTRFYDRLLKEAGAAGTDTSSRLKDAAARIDQCFIGTIHAFCSRLLRERPLEAGLPFDFKELDERDEPRARRRAWMDFTNNRLRKGDQRLQRLLEIGFSAENLYRFFSRRNEFPELKLKPTEAVEPDLAEAVRMVTELAAKSVPLMTPEGRAKPGKWGEAAMRALQLIEKRDLKTGADRAEFLLLFDSKSLLDGGVKVTRYTDKQFAYELRDQLVPALKREVIDPSLRAWKQYVYGLMGDLVDDAMT
ncbi:MAG: UvrD-helicase domain-containing protein, partial [Candidatus Latescibacterota bacterium]